VWEDRGSDKNIDIRVFVLFSNSVSEFWITSNTWYKPRTSIIEVIDTTSTYKSNLSELYRFKTEDGSSNEATVKWLSPRNKSGIGRMLHAETRSSQIPQSLRDKFIMNRWYNY
jgi:hypothetical protein